MKEPSKRKLSIIAHNFILIKKEDGRKILSNYTSNPFKFSSDSLGLDDGIPIDSFTYPTLSFLTKDSFIVLKEQYLLEGSINRNGNINDFNSISSIIRNKLTQIDNFIEFKVIEHTQM